MQRKVIIPYRPFLSLCLLLSVVSLDCVFATAPAPAPPPLGHHHGYVAQMVRPNPEQLYNHEAWHKKGFGTPSDDWTAESEASQSATQRPPLPKYDASPLRALTVNAGIQNASNINWNQTVADACSSVLARKHVTTSRNPSGKVSCYNVKSFQPSSGTFEADLRIYQVFAPEKSWSDLVDGSTNIGLSYQHALVTRQQNSLQKRHEHATYNDKQGKPDSDMVFTKRTAPHPAPQQIGQLALTGQVEPTKTDQLGKSDTAKEILTPMIRLSATHRDGTPLVLDLNDNRAMFIVGIFANSSRNGNGTADRDGPYALDIKAIMAEGNGLRRSQVAPLVVACIWIFVTSMPRLYGLWTRVRIKRDYRRRMNKGEELDVTVISFD